MIVYIIFFLVAIIASTVGAICGVGGGVLMKPVLDATGVMGVSAVSFLSSCTVLTMSAYSVVKEVAQKEKSSLDYKISTLLGIGAAVGGIVGKNIFQALLEILPNSENVGAVQAVCLFLICFALILFTWKRNKIRTLKIESVIPCIIIGFALGVMSSFLGIGGGPIDLAVLFYFFSMETKIAAQNALYIILFSQLASTINTVISGNIPDVSLWLLVIMVSGGILGGATGRNISKKIKTETVNKLFIILLAVIMVVCCYNFIKFL